MLRHFFAPVGVALTIAALTIAARAASGAAQSPSRDYYVAVRKAMLAMHTAMARPSTGDVDADFAAAMIPHHEGAVAMAQAVLLDGRDERIKRLAQQMIVEQRQEIAVLRSVLDARPAADGRSSKGQQ